MSSTPCFRFQTNFSLILNPYSPKCLLREIWFLFSFPLTPPAPPHLTDNEKPLCLSLLSWKLEQEMRVDFLPGSHWNINGDHTHRSWLFRRKSGHDQGMLVWRHAVWQTSLSFLLFTVPKFKRQMVILYDLESTLTSVKF